MRWPSSSLLALAACTVGCALAAPEKWSFESDGFDYSVEKGRGRLNGPVTLRYRDWTITASREALVTAKSLIVKTVAADGTKSYEIDHEPARIVFLGKCEAVNKAKTVSLGSTYLILSMENGTITTTGPGSVLLSEGKNFTTDDAEASVSIAVVSGEITRTEKGWKAAP